MSGAALTGDLQGNLEKLRGELKRARYDGDLAVDRLAAGDPVGFLPLLHFALLRFSRNVARWLVEHGYDLYGKTDLRFVESVYKLARQEFGYRHALTCSQFLSVGFAERKVLFAVDLLQLCRAKHLELAREASALRKKPARPIASSGTSATPRSASAHAPAAKTVVPRHSVQRHMPPGARLLGEGQPFGTAGGVRVTNPVAHQMWRDALVEAGEAVPAVGAVEAVATDVPRSQPADTSDCPMPALVTPLPYAPAPPKLAWAVYSAPAGLHPTAAGVEEEDEEDGEEEDDEDDDEDDGVDFEEGLDDGAKGVGVLSPSCFMTQLPSLAEEEEEEEEAAEEEAAAVVEEGAAA